MSMLKILSDPIINHAAGSFAKINTGPCNSASGFLVFYHFATKSLQNNKNLQFSADPPHKMGIALFYMYMMST